MSNVTNGLFFDAPAPSGRSSLIEQIRGVLADAAMEGVPEPSDPLERLVLDVVEALVDAEAGHDWGEVARVEIDATEGDWRATVRLTRDAGVGEPECAHTRQRRWR